MKEQIPGCTEGGGTFNTRGKICITVISYYNQLLIQPHGHAWRSKSGVEGHPHLTGRGSIASSVSIGKPSPASNRAEC